MLGEHGGTRKMGLLRSQQVCSVTPPNGRFIVPLPLEEKDDPVPLWCKIDHHFS